jgi:uncharacterized protein YdiU (UPF0061 family)
MDLPLPDYSGMRLACLNQRLLEEWGMSVELGDMDAAARWMKGAKHPYAMAYAGHQYGHFTMLGDGRAMLLGEWQHNTGICYDLHLKGSGPTPYARGGDGLATLRAMLREYLISEALHALGVPSTQSLMVMETPYKVWRDTNQRGGLLVRVAPHHVRIGTLEYAIRVLTPDHYALFAGAVLRRTTLLWSGSEDLSQGRSLYRSAKSEPEEVVAYFEQWSKRQAELVAHWMRVGFVHGVLNTDNISLLGITMDLGPCAFVNDYDLKRSFSSIDAQGRYAWGRQGEIMDWNAGVLLSCLLPLLDANCDREKALPIASDLLSQYRTACSQAMHRMQYNKLGLDPDLFLGHNQAQHPVQAQKLVEEWQAWLTSTRCDYTLAHLNLEQVLEQALTGPFEGDQGDEAGKESFMGLQEPEFPTGPGNSVPFCGPWITRWINLLKDQGEEGCRSALRLMREHNPALIPRNHLVEQALDQKVLHHCDDLWDEFSMALRNPYERNPANLKLNRAAPQGDAGYCTFCGT